MDALLRGDPHAVEALATDPAAWQPLLEHVITSRAEEAPAALVHALLARDPSVRSWLQRAEDGATRVVDSDVFLTVREAMRPFRRWLQQGILAARGPGDPAALEARLEQQLRDPGDDPVEDAEQLVAALAEVAPGSLVHAEGLELLTRRAIEEGRGERALAAVDARLSLPDPPEVMTRLRGVALLLAGRVDEGLASLEAALTEKRYFPLGGAQIFRSVADPVQAALNEVSQVAVWASWTTPEWVRALGGWAETSGDERVQACFLDALERLAAEEPAALAIVARQARQRGFEATAVEASARWEALRAPVEVPTAVELEDGAVLVGPFPSEEAVLACVDEALAASGCRRVEGWGRGRGIVRAVGIGDGWWVQASEHLLDVVGAAPRIVGGLPVVNPDDEWGPATEAWPVELAWDPDGERFSVVRAGERVCPLPAPDEGELAWLAALVAAGGRPDAEHPMARWFYER